MPKTISVHSFRGGTGKSNTTANLAAIYASQGMRVGVIDTDILSPGIHVLFGLDENAVKYSLNDYLWGNCEIDDAAYNVTDMLNSTAVHPIPPPGKIYLIPSSMNVGEIARVLKTGYDVNLLNDGIQNLTHTLDLDILLIDTHPGLNEETLLSIAISDTLAIILRPDQQDYQGTKVTVEVARRLGVPLMTLIINKTPGTLNFDNVRIQIEHTYSCSVGAVLPHSDEMMILASAGVFALRYPNHPIVQSLRAASNLMLGD
jgi:MinD-like ATPase involved in chromosome partitioning or flagellar assembly